MFWRALSKPFPARIQGARAHGWRALCTGPADPADAV